MAKLCECGCGRPTKPATQTRRRDGVVKGEPQRFVKGHARRVGRPPVRRGDGCLIWQGRPSAQGYGRTVVDGKTIPAHVAVWVEANGPVPEDHEIDHTCFERMCVELTHLECVTRAENRRRAALRRWHG
jgi:hypothetical protein